MRLFYIILTVLFSVNLCAQDTDAVYEKILKEYTLKDDGSIEFHYYKKLKLNTHYSFNRLYGETFIIYNPKFQDLKINLSQTTQESGKVVKAPENSFNEVLPSEARDAAFYNGLREMVVTHVGLEVGAVIELDYTITSKAGFLPGLMEDEIITESSPIVNKEIIVNIPLESELNYKVLNIRTGPNITESKKYKTYSFTFTGIAENTHESHQPSNNLHLPRLYFSTLSFAEALNFITKQDAFFYKTDKGIKAAIENLKKDKTNKFGTIRNDVEFILEIQKMVSEDFNLYGIQPAYTGYHIRNALDVWKSNGGTACEKSLLMVSLLREVGIHSKAVVVIPSKLYDEKIGCLPLIENILVRISPLESEMMYLSAIKTSDQNEIFDLNNKTLVVFDPGKNAVENISEKFENKLIASGSLVLDNEFKTTGSLEVLMTEKLNPYYKIRKDSSAVNAYLEGISKKEIIRSEIINSAQFRTLAKLEIKTDEALKNQANYYFYEIPGLKGGSESWHMPYLNSERITSFEVPNTINEQYSFSITLPEGVQFINPVDLTEVKADFGEMLISTSIKENIITVKRMLKIQRTVISPEEYPKFKEMMDLWNEKNFRQLILKNKT
ncbi:MAG: DUF3857 domain-containing protein [Bacteroidales bacterium]|nr:DUF3857 domain-containing protein [Bacteroidales bacterium]MCF8405789.1 DUF3857 domain-containing protein [Bacteroidales bacterium]